MPHEEDQGALEQVFDVDEVGVSRGSVALKVVTLGAKQKVILVDDFGNATATLNLRDVSSIHVVDEQTVRLKKAGSLLFKVTVSFKNSSFLEQFLDTVRELRPSLDKGFQTLRKAGSPRPPSERPGARLDDSDSEDDDEDDDDDGNDDEGHSESDDEEAHRARLREDAEARADQRAGRPVKIKNIQEMLDISEAEHGTAISEDEVLKLQADADDSDLLGHDNFVPRSPVRKSTSFKGMATRTRSLKLFPGGRSSRMESKLPLHHVVENIVFESHNDLRFISKALKRALVGKVKVQMRRTLNSGACAIDFQGSHASFDVFEAGIRSLDDGDDDGRGDAWKFVCLSKTEKKRNAKEPDGTEATGRGATLRRQNSPATFGDYDYDEQDVEPFHFTLDCRTIEEANRFLSVLNALREAGENMLLREANARRQIKTFTLKRQRAAKPVPAPSLDVTDASFLQQHAWSAINQEWFETQANIFIGTFNVGDASPPKSRDGLSEWIPRSTESKPIKMYAIGLQEVSSKFDEWEKAIAAYLGDNYASPMGVRMWEVVLLVFVHMEELPHINSRSAGSVKTGLRLGSAVQLGNKGGVGIGFRWRDIPICFINAHLSAQQHKVSERNLNYTQIMSKLSLHGPAARIDAFPLEPTLFFEQLFFLGDLNYRVELDFKQAARATTLKNYNLLHLNDQLQHQLKDGTAFHGFTSPIPDFPPTYRWKRGRRELSNKKEQPPSYTDRILWHSHPGSKDSVVLQRYFCADGIMISDHRPVGAEFTLALRHEYSWPLHPLTSPTTREITETRKMDEGGWTSHNGDFFVAPREAVGLGAPRIQLQNVVVSLDATEDGSPLPSWINMCIASPILHQIEWSAAAAGTELSPDLRAGKKGAQRFAYQGTGAFQDLYYAFDPQIGVPLLKPIVFDPLFLKSQHLFVHLSSPSTKDEEVLSLHHILLNAKTSEQMQEMANNLARPRHVVLNGQSCISLRNVVQAVGGFVSRNGLKAWTAKVTPTIPFSEPIICGGLQIGKLMGEICILPPTEDARRSARKGPGYIPSPSSEEGVFGSLELPPLVRSGAAQVKYHKSYTRVSTRVYLNLYKDGRAFLLSQQIPKRKSVRPTHNVLAVLDMRHVTIDDHLEFSFAVHECRPIGPDASGLVTMLLAVESRSDKLAWIEALESVHSDAAFPQDSDYETDEEVVSSEIRAREASFVRAGASSLSLPSPVVVHDSAWDSGSRNGSQRGGRTLPPPPPSVPPPASMRPSYAYPDEMEPYLQEDPDNIESPPPFYPPDARDAALSEFSDDDVEFGDDESVLKSDDGSKLFRSESVASAAARLTLAVAAIAHGDGRSSEAISRYPPPPPPPPSPSPSDPGDEFDEESSRRSGRRSRWTLTSVPPPPPPL
ncbi:Inositol polyphosphate-5-phosphatase, putative [Hondaea fermentalgiana]|uniref:Inositol polyphosphate-5-phosphatase, putative n=1 Tax=Hondaea fermentalgiana TaxID=2315210 RepID=A0A2R5GKD2_9STRA|nr:Inositol polyphosphate-5-phosphatase, putative [Hondaea fermentalgiana]|eukprot:GBG28741.1 Inositol polyphosphate-5-phosphatase, putative [Hondaea fermentalgiana]